MTTTRILVCEDEGVVAMDIQSHLISLDYDVPKTVSTGNNALAAVEKLKPDLVLMDIMIRGEIDGITTAGMIRERYGIPIIYLTAYSDNGTLERAKQTEPYGYILKPFEERDLRTTVEMALHKHRIEKKLKENERWLATILKSIGDGVITTDIHGNINFMNPIAENLTGWKADNATGKKLADVYNASDEDTAESPDQSFLQWMQVRESSKTSGDIKFIDRDGKTKDLSENVSHIKDDSGSVTGIVVVIRDITEVKKLEQELFNTQKLESIGILAGGIAHDFNNLLTGIMGNVSLLRILADPNHPNFELLTEIDHASRRARDLTQQLLTFSKGGNPVKESLSIVDFVKETSTFCLRGSKTDVDFIFPDNLWYASIDKGQISQVVSNLVINAEQAMPDGGTIDIKAENVELDESNTPSLKCGRYIKITIVDHGSGISKEILSKIFDPYFTTKKKGAGLGLSICHSIVKNHEGTISIKSESGRGSTVELLLPASQVESAKTFQDNSLPTGSGRILVLDDQDIVGNVIKAMLPTLGYTVDFVKNGNDVIEKYRQAISSNDKFSAVILDLTIPGGIGGKEVTTELLKIDPAVKAIACSGYSNDPIMSNYEDYGFAGVVNKPFDIHIIANQLNHILSPAVT